MYTPRVKMMIEEEDEYDDKKIKTKLKQRNHHVSVISVIHKSSCILRTNAILFLRLHNRLRYICSHLQCI
jgi:hypothetical protein